MKYTAKNANEAWSTVDVIFSTDYILDEFRSERAGYPVYKSTADDHPFDYICDLGDRLEVNHGDGTTDNVWIIPNEQEPEPEQTAPAATVKVAVKAMKSGEVRTYEYDEFIDNIRFYWSSGAEHSDFETKLKKMRDQLMQMNDHGDAVETIYGGLIIKVILYKYPGFDRYLKRV